MASPEQTPPTPGQAPPTAGQAPSAPDTSGDVDHTYKLLAQQIDGARPTQCSNPDDHISVRIETTSDLNPDTYTNQVLCRAYCNWSGYRGDRSMMYFRREDTLCMGKLDELNLQTGHGIHGTVIDMDIVPYSSGTHFPGGKVVMDEGRYVRMNVTFAAAAGSPARSAKVWGKRVVGNEAWGPVTLSEEEILKYAKEGNAWTRQPADFHARLRTGKSDD